MQGCLTQGIDGRERGAHWKGRVPCSLFPVMASIVRAPNPCHSGGSVPEAAKDPKCWAECLQGWSYNTPWQACSTRTAHTVLRCYVTYKVAHRRVSGTQGASLFVADANMH